MSDKPTTVPLDKTIAPPQVRGITTAAREARAAEERTPSADTLAIMPGVADLARELGVRMPGQAKALAEPEEEESGEEEEAPEEAEEEAGGEGEEEAAPEEGAGAGTEVAEPDAEEGEELPPEAVKIRTAMQKRIDKLTARGSELELQLQDSRVKNARFEREFGPAPTAENPLADVQSDAELQQRLIEARSVKQWALRNRNGGEIPGKDGAEGIYYDADQVAAFLANAEQVIDLAPQRAGWIAEAAKAEALGREQAPMFYRTGSDSAKTIETVMAQVPASVKAWRPDIKLILIQALVGAHVLAAQAKAGPGNGGKPAQVSVKKAPPSPTGRQAPKTTTKVVTQRKNAQQLRKGSGNVRDLAAVLGDRLGF